MSGQATLNFDICANRSQHQGLSDEANRIAPKEIDRMLVYEFIKNDRRGLTLHEICARMAKTPNCVSPRITELLKAGRIVRDGWREFQNHHGSVYKAVSR